MKEPLLQWKKKKKFKLRISQNNLPKKGSLKQAVLS